MYQTMRIQHATEIVFVATGLYLCPSKHTQMHPPSIRNYDLAFHFKIATVSNRDHP